MYKIETHLHTREVSPCAKLEVEAILEAYKKADFSAICVTDHYSTYIWEKKNIDIHAPGDKLEAFLEGYYKMKDKASAYDIEIILGAEVRFLESVNEYLIYGFDPELLREPKEILAMGIARFSKLAKEKGIFIAQAHPFRGKGNYCVPVAPMFMEGVEVVNNNPRHLNNNEWTMAFADKYNLIKLAGSDCHEAGDEGTGGILSEVVPKDTFEMAKLLRENKFELYLK